MQLPPRTMIFLGAIVLVLALPTYLASAQQILPAPDSAGSHDAAAAFPQAPIPQTFTTLSCSLIDSTGAAIAGAVVTLEDTQAHKKRTTVSDNDGAFTFAAVPSGTFTLSVAAVGFAPWSTPGIVGRPGETEQLTPITLQLASIDSSVQAITVEELAEQQIKVEESQRVLGIVPNFYVTYTWNAAPLSPKQKFSLALRATYDPFNFIGSGVAAGIEQSQNSLSGYGQGAAGYGKRYAAAYGDGLFGTFMGGAVFPTILHQDPRYFYKGTGSIASRALYAISTVVITKGDNGRWQPNYSSVLGDFAAAGISEAYYPASDRDSGSVLVDNVLLGTAEGAAGALIQEFLIRKLTRHPPPAVSGNP